jgi:putative hydrolase of the HAD superfamily
MAIRTLVFDFGNVLGFFSRQQAARQLAACGPPEVRPEAIVDYLFANEPVCSLVPALQTHHRLVLLSNTNPLHVRHFRRQFADTLDRFDALIVSHEVGVRKPDRRIYEHALGAANCQARECLFIDDLPDNVATACELGWQGVVYRADDDLGDALRRAGVHLAA